jgi:hypothetical protein
MSENKLIELNITLIVSVIMVGIIAWISGHYLAAAIVILVIGLITFPSMAIIGENKVVKKE